MISVIVPAYNVEPYLEKCVESLVRQTYKELEIILVNDGSTDGTGALCDRLALTDERIKVIHKKNGGASDARNVGINVAEGEFYSFIDGDDFIEPDTYECMVAEMRNPDVSIVAAGLIDVDIQGITTFRVSPRRQTLTKEEAFKDIFGGKGYITQSSGNKLFRSSLFEKIRYKKGIINEDMEILPRLLDISNSVVLLDKPVYHYIKKPGSVTTSSYSMKRYEAIRIEEDVYRMCKAKYPDLQPYAGYYELRSLYGMLCNLTGCDNRKDFKVQELAIRRKIISTFIRCNRWKAIREEYGDEMKAYFLNTLLGTQNVKRLVELKYRILNVQSNKK